MAYQLKGVCVRIACIPARILLRPQSRHALGRNACHGNRGKLKQRYKTGQEDQLGALGVVTNAIILWNTIYLDEALTAARTAGIDIAVEDIAHLSPLIHRHINLEGRYTFTGIAPTTELRALRDPNQPDPPDL
jgi:hypothetical protein